MDGTPRWRRVALAVCMFLITGVFGFLQTFVSLYLASAELSKADIGIVTGIGTGVALLVQPLLGWLSDRIDARRPIMVAAAIAAGAAYLSFRQARGLIAFTALTAVGVNGYQYLNAVGGVLVGRLVAGSGRGGGAAYTGFRVWGSVGYIVVAMGTGVIVSQTLPAQTALRRADLDGVFTYGPLLFFAIAVAALFVPDLKRVVPVAGGAVGESAVRASPAKTANMNRFLVAFFLYQFALYGASAYLPLYMKSLGASYAWITGMFAAGVICEVTAMSQIGRLSDIYGRRPALAIAFLVMPLRLLLYIPATGPLWVLFVQTLHGLNFGIIGAIAIVFVNDLADEHARGRAQARLAAVAGVGLALGPVTCGWIADRFGFGWMFAAMSLVGFAGAAVFLGTVAESHPSPSPLRGPWRWLSGRATS